MLKKTIKISIGVPAYNEEANIAILLNCILSQKEISFKIIEILILSDGSDDKTIEIAKSFKDSRIKVLSFKDRLGKPSRLNQIFRRFRGGYLLMSDADVKYSGKLVIERMARKIVNNPDLSLVMAKVHPFNNRGILERGIYNFFYARDRIKTNYDYRKTVYAARAAGMLLAKKFARSLHLPTEILNDDAYIYLVARSMNLEISFVDKAVIWYRTVSNFSDYMKQFKRYLDGEKQMYKYFNGELLKQEYRAPRIALLEIMFRQIKRDFLAYAVLRVMNSICQYQLNLFKDTTKVQWSIALSSKALFINHITHKGLR